MKKDIAMDATEMDNFQNLYTLPRLNHKTEES